MSYAIRNDGQGWRAINSIADVDTATETFSEVQPIKTAEDALKEFSNNEVMRKIAGLEVAIAALNRHVILRPNAPMSRPSGPPKTPVQVIADIDAQIEALKATLKP